MVKLAIARLLKTTIIDSISIIVLKTLCQLRFKTQIGKQLNTLIYSLLKKYVH